MTIELDPLPPCLHRLCGVKVDSQEMGHDYDWALFRSMDQSCGAAIVDTLLAGAVKHDQLGLSCVGETIAQVAAALLLRTTGVRHEFSALAAYRNARIFELKLAGEIYNGQYLPDDGTSPLVAAEAWLQCGLPLEQDFPRILQNLDRDPGAFAAHAGSLHKKAKIYVLSSDPLMALEQLRTSVRAGFPGMVSVPVNDDFQRLGPDGIVRYISGPYLAKHRMPVLGLDPKGRPICLNSWAHWGADQLCFLDDEVFEAGQVTSISVVTDLKHAA